VLAISVDRGEQGANEVVVRVYRAAGTRVAVLRVEGRSGERKMDLSAHVKIINEDNDILSAVEGKAAEGIGRNCGGGFGGRLG